MDAVGLDPMVDIFIEECTGLLEEYRNMAEVVKEQRSWDEEAINEVFRITHTLKGDATMMLCENIAVPMRALERVLYYYREEKERIFFSKRLARSIGISTCAKHSNSSFIKRMTLSNNSKKPV